jgi:sterol desaturase/sphingolipid hydroxylase (fatty acid hydroxylase superfamily)
VRAALRRWLWPSFVGASALAYAIGFARGAAESVVLIVPGLQVMLLFALEAAWPAEPQGASHRDPQLGNDFAHNVVGFALGTRLSEGIVLALVALLAGRVAGLAGGAVWPQSWPFAAQALLAVFAADGLDTLRHRWLHRSRRLWPIHAVHHAGEHLNVAKSGRNHFLDLGLRGLFVYGPLAVLGAPTEVLLAHPAAVSVLGPIAHANLELAVPRWLHRWVMTPAVHHVHHARELRRSLHNYTNVFPLWDRLLGSFLDPGDAPRPAAGLEQDPNPPGFWAQLLAPLGWR